MTVAVMAVKMADSLVVWSEMTLVVLWAERSASLTVATQDTLKADCLVEKTAACWDARLVGTTAANSVAYSVESKVALSVNWLVVKLGAATAATMVAMMVAAKVCSKVDTSVNRSAAMWDVWMVASMVAMMAVAKVQSMVVWSVTRSVVM